jgi:phosphatidylinositol glycan class B
LQVFSDESRVAGVIASDTSLFLAAIRTDMTDDTVEPSRSVDPSVSDRYTGLPLGGAAASVALPYPSRPGLLDRWPSWAIGLAALIVFGVLLRIGLALAFPRIHHADELFQYYEQAHRLAFGQGIVPWEYREGIRSWLLPGLLAGLMKAVSWVSDDPSAYLGVSKTLWSVLSLSIPGVAFLWARRASGLTAALTAAFIATVWFELIYYAPTALTESIATSLLLVGCWLAWTAETTDRRRLIAAGVLFGLVFVFRFHLLPAILTAAVVASRGDWRGRLRPMLLAALVPVLLCNGLLDWVTLGWPFQSVLKNFWINIVEEKSRSFGVMPWGFYFEEYARIWSWWLLPMGALIVMGARGQPMLVAVPVAIILSHSFVAHKEYRFVLPALPFLLILAALGTERLARRLSEMVPGPRWAPLVMLCAAWVLASGLLSVSERWRPEWSRVAPGIATASALHDREALCGLGLLTPWWDLPGYTTLHRDVPVFWFGDDTRRFWRSARTFNYIMARPEQMPANTGFQLESCPSEICLYRRPGQCAPPADITISGAMAEHGM